MVASAAKNTVNPNSGESYRDFVFRAHNQLMPTIPSWESRNKAVWDAWDKAHGNPIREQAQQYFAKDCPRFVPDVCYFMEHETIGSDGQPVKYGFKELADICEEMNGRCDTHNYSAIADRHTIRGIVPETLQPKVVGYTGSTRLGMVGNQDPKWAVFMDEHHLSSGISTLDEKKRRSVEVNRFRDGRRPYFDPIAALGADSPRLPLPVARYSANDGDPNHIIDQYEAPVMVGAGGTYIPSMGDPKKRVDQYEDQLENPGGDGMNISPEDANAIVQALMQTPEFQFVRQLMQSQGGPAQQQQPSQPQPQAGPQPSQPAHNPPSQEPMGGPSMSSHQPTQQQPHAQPQRYSGSNDPNQFADQYAQLLQENVTLRDQYSQLVEHNKQLVAEFADLRTATAQLEMRAVDGERTQRLTELYQQFPHVIDLDEEKQTCLYSLGSELNNDQFEAHCKLIEKYAQRSVPGSKMVPGGNASVDSYSGDVGEMKKRIVDRYTAYADKGIFKSTEEIAAEIEAENRGQRV